MVIVNDYSNDDNDNDDDIVDDDDDNDDNDTCMDDAIWTCARASLLSVCKVHLAPVTKR